MLIQCIIKRESPKAYLIEIKGKEEWFPRSQVKRIEPAPSGAPEDVEIADWLAKKAGIA